MATLREIKDRIGSVRGTLKITSAMKLVASAKMRRAQSAAESMVAYSKVLEDIISSVRLAATPVEEPAEEPVERPGKTLIVAISSNTALCGAFNINVAKTVRDVLATEKDAEVLAIGRKISDVAVKAGYPQKEDFSQLIGKPDYEPSAALAEKLVAKFDSGEYSKILFVYTHFYSKAHQAPVVEQFLPMVPHTSDNATVPEVTDGDAYILEPGADEILETVLPQVQKLKFYSVILDSAAAEHAARTLAMQAASDNAEDLLSELSLQYNKRRQEKITSEILDIVGGSAR